jgi:hypothetical protein
MFSMKRISLDVCCLNRPFDDQSIDRIHLESETGEVDVVVTTDDKLTRLALRHLQDIKVTVSNPLQCLQKVMDHGGDYTAEREQLLGNPGLQTLAAEIQRRQHDSSS